MSTQQVFRRALKALAVANLVFVTASAAAGATISVPLGGDLHAALTNAQPGDVIALVPGATYTGNFTLPNKDGSEFITIRTAGPDKVAEGRRVTIQQAASFAKIKSPNNQPAIQTAPGAHHWRLVLLELQGSATGDGDILTLGSGSSAQNSLSQVPHDLVVDRCYIHGDAVNGQKRGIALNSAATTITGSYISDCKRIGQDSQAIAGWNGPGPFTISNNYLEGAAENVMFGGADPSIPELIPSDIRITDNLISKPLSWRSEKWQIKNLVELKNARRVTIDHNIIQYSWVQAQVGFAILFTVRNQDGGCPWCQVEQVVFEHNIVQHTAAGVSILGTDNGHPSRQTHSITIRNNVFADIDNNNWGGNGYCFSLTGGPRDIVIDHNTMVQEHAYGILQVDGPPVLGFSFTNNITRHNAYGIKGDNHASGNDTISAFFPASQVSHNVIADGDAGRYPHDNLFPSSTELRAQFVGYQSNNFRLVPASSWRAAASDGRDIGADLAALPGGAPPDPRDREPR